MEGNSITSFENLCKIFEMRIKLDREKGIKTSLDVLNNYEKYAKKIDSIYNNEFQKELKPLISPAVTLEKEEDRLRRLIKLLEKRLNKRIELEDRFYNSTGKNITGLQLIVSEDELEEKKERLSLISNYLETNREIENINDSLNKLKESLAIEEAKKEEYEDKNKIMEEELYSSFISVIKEDDYYKKINEDDINSLLDEIRSKVSETKETLDITKESVGSLINNGLEDDYTSYIVEAEKNYYSYKNKEIVLKIYKSVMVFEDDFKLICSKREKINELLEEKKNLKESLTIETDDELLSFEKTLLMQVKTLDSEREILENIVNYTSRIKFKEERLEELNEINSSPETLVILREYGLIDTYDTEDIVEEIAEDEEITKIELPKLEEPIVEVVYNPYRIVEVKDYPKTLNVGLAKLKGESVREKVNKKLNPKEEIEINHFETKVNENKSDNIPLDNNQIDTTSIYDVVTNNDESLEVSASLDTINSSSNDEIKAETPVWELPTEVNPKPVSFENQNAINLPVWDIQPSFDVLNSKENNEEISSIEITSNPSESSDDNDGNAFWIPVSDSKLETKDFPNINIPVNNNFNGNDNFVFPTINN